jgi:hypothetical protein
MALALEVVGGYISKEKMVEFPLSLWPKVPFDMILSLYLYAKIDVES